MNKNNSEIGCNQKEGPLKYNNFHHFQTPDLLMLVLFYLMLFYLDFVSNLKNPNGLTS